MPVTPPAADPRGRVSEVKPNRTSGKKNRPKGIIPSPLDAAEADAARRRRPSSAVRSRRAAASSGTAPRGIAPADSLLAASSNEVSQAHFVTPSSCSAVDLEGLGQAAARASPSTSVPPEREAPLLHRDDLIRKSRRRGRGWAPLPRRRRTCRREGQSPLFPSRARAGRGRRPRERARSRAAGDRGSRGRQGRGELRGLQGGGRGEERSARRKETSRARPGTRRRRGTRKRVPRSASSSPSAPWARVGVARGRRSSAPRAPD